MDTLKRGSSKSGSRRVQINGIPMYDIVPINLTPDSEHPLIIRAVYPSLKLIINSPLFWQVLSCRIPNWEKVGGYYLSMLQFYQFNTSSLSPGNKLLKRFVAGPNKYTHWRYSEEQNPLLTDIKEREKKYMTHLKREAGNMAKSQTFDIHNALFYKNDEKMLTKYGFFQFKQKIIDRCIELYNARGFEKPKEIIDDLEAVSTSVFEHEEKIRFNEIFKKLNYLFVEYELEENQYSGDITFRDDEGKKRNMAAAESKFNEIIADLLAMLKNHIVNRRVSKNDRNKKKKAQELMGILEAASREDNITEKVKLIVDVSNELADKEAAYLQFLREAELHYYFLLSEFSKHCFPEINNHLGFNKEERRLFILLNIRLPSLKLRIAGLELNLLGFLEFKRLPQMFYQAVLKRESPAAKDEFRKEIPEFFSFMNSINELIRLYNSDKKKNDRYNKRKTNLDVDKINVDEIGSGKRGKKHSTLDESFDGNFPDHNELEQDSIDQMDAEEDSNAMEKDDTGYESKSKKAGMPSVIPSKTPPRHSAFEKYKNQIDLKYLIESNLTDEDAEILTLWIVEKLTEEEIAEAISKSRQERIKNGDNSIEKPSITQQAVAKKITKIIKKLQDVNFSKEDITDWL